MTFDFRELKVTINKEGKHVSLQGKTEEGITKVISVKTMDKLLSKSNTRVTGYLFFMQGNSQDEDLELKMNKLLHEYEDIFQEPKGMPPERNQDYKIPLIAGSHPVNMRSYRIPYVQKIKVERKVQEMLESGII